MKEEIINEARIEGKSIFRITNNLPGGSTHWYYVEAPKNLTDDEISDLIANKLTEIKQRHDQIKFFGWRPLFGRRKLKIDEYNTTTKKPIKNGRKGQAYLSVITFKGENLFNGEKFVNKQSWFNVELYGN